MKKLLLALFCLSAVSGFSFDGDNGDENTNPKPEEVTECAENTNESN